MQNRLRFRIFKICALASIDIYDKKGRDNELQGGQNEHPLKIRLQSRQENRSEIQTARILQVIIDACCSFVLLSGSLTLFIDAPLFNP